MCNVSCKAVVYFGRLLHEVSCGVEFRSMQTLRGSQMKSYRCVFRYASGNTTIDIAADDGERAIEAAASAINAGDYDRVEVWDGATLLLIRATPRAWDALGDLSPPAPMPSEQHYPLSLSLPRRAPTSFAASLKALGLHNAKARWQRLVARKG